jgi:hypothetical protein
VDDVTRCRGLLAWFGLARARLGAPARRADDNVAIDPASIALREVNECLQPGWGRRGTRAT